MTDSLLVTLSVNGVVTLPGRPDISIRLVRVIEGEVRLGITAPRSVPVVRRELIGRKRRK